MFYTGYSIDVDDCVAIPRATTEKVVNYSIRSDIEEQPEHFIIEQLNNAKDRIMGMAKQKLCRHGQVNGFMVSVKSGAKGSLFNLYQMTGMLGQQYINGARLSDPSMPVQGLHQRGFRHGFIWNRVNSQRILVICAIWKNFTMRYCTNYQLDRLFSA